MPADPTKQTGATTATSPGASPATSQSASPSGSKNTAEEVKQQARETAEKAASKATDYARTQADRGKEAVADEISGTANALRDAARSMSSGSPQERTFGQIAESLADASESLRDKDLGTLMSDVNTFARSNPVVFLGGAALLGFAAARFAKASANNPQGGHATGGQATRDTVQPTPQAAPARPVASGNTPGGSSNV